MKMKLPHNSRTSSVRDDKPEQEGDIRSENGPTYFPPEAIEALKEGSHEAFDSVYLALAGPMKRFLLRMTGSEETSSEILQTVFMKLWEHRAELDPGRNIKSYLYTSSKNLFLNQIRDSKPVEDISAEMSLPGYGSDDPDQMFIAHETRLLIDIAVRQMPGNRQEVFRLFQQGLSYEEIALRLDISAENVYQHISRARKDIAKQLLSLTILTFLMV